MIDMEKFRENWKKEHSVICPHCKKDLTDDSEFMQYLITYHGEDGIKELQCPCCDENLYIEEHVDRTWSVGKEVIQNEYGFDKIKETI